MKTADPVTALSVTLDGQPISVEAALAYRSTLPHSRLTTGDHTLTLTVRTGGTTTLTRTQTFQVK
ncbi:hypothetical protein [Deinococcus sp.]|uniref:hypothetical protein n=1 Tax=Deinococcus sp. TaxID=47478 RepID=UPI003C7CE6BE